MKRLSRIPFLLLMLSGCMVGPNYHPPEISMPTEFIETNNQETSPASNCTLCEWWKQFNDLFLDALLEEATAGNFDFRLALERILQARAQYRVERSFLFPEFDFNASATRSRNSQDFIGSTSSTSTTTGGTSSTIPVFQNFFEVGFDAIWEFDFFGKFRRAKKAAFYQWEASKEDAQDVLISILSEVARNYVNICALQQKIDITSQKIQADEEELALTQALLDSGLDSEIQLETLVAAVENDKAALPPLEASLKQTIYSLALLLGKQPETLAAEFEENRPIPSGINKVPIGLPSDLLRRRPDIRRAERQLAAATEQIGVAVADLFPHIALTGTTFAGSPTAGSAYGAQSSTLKHLLKPASRFWSIGPSIRWNLIDFGRTFGNIAIQNSLQRQALLTYEQTVITSLQDVEGALAAYFEEQKRTSSISNQVYANSHSLELTEDLYQAGLANQLQVLEAQKTLLDSKNTLIDSQQALTSDLIALYKALGGNWECSYSR